MFKLRREQKEALAGEFGTVGMVAPCQYCLVVRFVEIRGLYKPGHDDGLLRPPGIIRNTGYLPGYASEDDRGRIFNNRDVDGEWKKGMQGVEITVRVDPAGIPIPPGMKITWSFEDPDDPTNETPKMHRDAGRILDPNDYVGRTKVGKKAGDNDPRKRARSKPRFTELEPRFPLSGNQTPIDPLTRESKVRFDVSDVAGDNFRVRAEITPIKPIVATVPAITGIMTVWNRFDIEYVKMASATDLPVEQIASHFDLACVQLDVSSSRVVTGDLDKPVLGETEADADHLLEFYATVGGVFTKEQVPGWLLLVAANLQVPEKTRAPLYEGEAFAEDLFIRFPPGKLYWGTPGAVGIYDPAKSTGLGPHYPSDLNLATAFQAGVLCLSGGASG